MDKTLVFIAAKRTPFGSFGGSFKSLSATDLATIAAEAALKQSKLPPEVIDHVTFGNVIASSPDAAYLARHVALRIGLPVPTPALTLNRLCGSGFEAIADGARRILLAEATAVLVGGSENMSQAPFVLRNARFGYRMNHGEIEDSLMAGLTDSYIKTPMALTAEKLGEKFGITREACDAFALRSQQLAEKAHVAGRFAEELAPVTIPSKDKPKIIDKDEHIRPDASLAGMQKLKPVFKKEGLVTAGNASGMVDGACALILTTKAVAEKYGSPILGTYVGAAVVGCDPSIMGIGPVGATKKALSQAGLKLEEMKLVEINEAFAAQVLAVLKELPVSEERFNIDGGAIGIGHPLGASGARLVAHALYRMQSLSGGYACTSACIGGGQGMTVLLRV